MIRWLSNHGFTSCFPRAEGPNASVFFSVDVCLTFHHPDVTTMQPRRRRWNECCRFVPPPPSSWLVLECQWYIWITPLTTKTNKKNEEKKKRLKEQKRTTDSATFVACFYFILVGVIFTTFNCFTKTKKLVCLSFLIEDALGMHCWTTFTRLNQDQSVITSHKWKNKVHSYKKITAPAFALL